MKPKRLWLKISLVIILVLAVSGGTYAYSIYNNAKQTVNKKMHQNVRSINQEVGKKKMGGKKPLNILLLGVDQRLGDGGRSDALMVLSLDPKDNKIQVIIVPGDTRTRIVGKDFDDKIKHTYAFGGVDMSVATIEGLLDIDLDYYVEMNMEGLSEMVNAIGGITVQNEPDWVDTGYYKKGYYYKRGDISLDGPKTMGYVRMRYEDPDGDFGRTKRQRKVFEAIVNKGASVALVNKINDMVDVLGNNMATNMDFDDMNCLIIEMYGKM